MSTLLPSTASEAAGYHGAPEGQDQNARKRKRNTISCFECRARKRRCIVVVNEDCESCVREGLECRRPDIDGRKIRWQKGKVTSESDTGSIGQQDGGLEGSGQGLTTMNREFDIDGTYLDSLFDLIMGTDSSRSMVTKPTVGTTSLTLEPATGGPDPTSSLHSIPENPFDAPGDPGLDMREDDLTWHQFSHPAKTNDDDYTVFPWIGPSPTSVTQQRGSMDPSHCLNPATSPSNLPQSPRVKKMVWWRSHGPSAIAPGLKRITLKVRLEDKFDPASPALPLAVAGQAEAGPVIHNTIMQDDGMPRQDLMLHLLGVFMTHFGCQYPVLDRTLLERDLEQKSGSTLLFNCIASSASRFSNHTDIALPGLEPHSYGLIFLKTAKDMLGNMLAVPTRETVIALTLLAGISHGIDSESEEWMMAGMAVRMAIDLGLHQAPPPDSSISEDERRLNRLTFWSVYFLDVSLSFGVGRETAFRIESITQTIPVESDFEPSASGTTVDSNVQGVKHAFAYAAKLALVYGPLVNVVNGPWDNHSAWETEARRITQQAVEVYNALPQDMQWSAYNLQNLSRADQGSVFVQMHLWMHTILASGYLIGTDVVRPDRPSLQYGTMTPPTNSTATRLWQNSARTIGDILILTDIVNPFAYHALPFSNQPFVVAGCCYIKEADSQNQLTRFGSDINHNIAKVAGTSGLPGPGRNGEPDGIDMTTRGASNRDEKAEMFRTLLQSVVLNNITALQQGLKRQTRYWAGVAWVAEVLAQRMSGVKMNEIDLQQVTEGLDSTVTTSDARMFQSEGKIGRAAEPDFGPLLADQPEGSSGMFDMQLPLEADWMADTALLQSEGYPVEVENFTSDWASNYFR